MVYVLPKAQEGILKCHVLSTTKKNIQFTDIVEETSQETRKWVQSTVSELVILFAHLTVDN